MRCCKRAGTYIEYRGMTHGYIQTGQLTCHDTSGREVACAGSGQDAEFRKGDPWPSPRFEPEGGPDGGMVRDNLTGLVWTRDAEPAGFPLSWQESIDFIERMNAEKALGCSDWRLPNRRELRSLISHQEKNPALPAGHPFRNVVLAWYWTSSTAAVNCAYAWYVHMEGARTFYGGKSQYFMLWPVRGEGNGLLPATGQVRCFDHAGGEITCLGTGQDGEYRRGRLWPELRFQLAGDTVIDWLTGLGWMRVADSAGGPVTWEEALYQVAGLNPAGAVAGGGWRLPNINELESLVDLGRHSPALPANHPFGDVRDGYWSSTTSMYEPDWAWALYLTKGAVGIGRKQGTYFSAWAVRDI